MQASTDVPIDVSSAYKVLSRVSSVSPSTFAVSTSPSQVLLVSSHKIQVFPVHQSSLASSSIVAPAPVEYLTPPGPNNSLLPPSDFYAGGNSPSYSLDLSPHSAPFVHRCATSLVLTRTSLDVPPSSSAPLRSRVCRFSPSPSLLRLPPASALAATTVVRLPPMPAAAADGNGSKGFLKGGVYHCPLGMFPSTLASVTSSSPSSVSYGGSSPRPRSYLVSPLLSRRALGGWSFSGVLLLPDTSPALPTPVPSFPTAAPDNAEGWGPSQAAAVPPKDDDVAVMLPITGAIEMLRVGGPDPRRFVSFEAISVQDKKGAGNYLLSYRLIALDEESKNPEAGNHGNFISEKAEVPLFLDKDDASSSGGGGQSKTSVLSLSLTPPAAVGVDVYPLTRDLASGLPQATVLAPDHDSVLVVLRHQPAGASEPTVALQLYTAVGPAPVQHAALPPPPPSSLEAATRHAQFTVSAVLLTPLHVALQVKYAGGVSTLRVHALAFGAVCVAEGGREAPFTFAAWGGSSDASNPPPKKRRANSATSPPANEPTVVLCPSPAGVGPCRHVLVVSAGAEAVVAALSVRGLPQDGVVAGRGGAAIGGHKTYSVAQALRGVRMVQRNAAALTTAAAASVASHTFRTFEASGKVEEHGASGAPDEKRLERLLSVGKGASDLELVQGEVSFAGRYCIDRLSKGDRDKGLLSLMKRVCRTRSFPVHASESCVDGKTLLDVVFAMNDSAALDLLDTVLKFCRDLRETDLLRILSFVMRTVPVKAIASYYNSFSIDGVTSKVHRVAAAQYLQELEARAATRAAPSTPSKKSSKRKGSADLTVAASAPQGSSGAAALAPLTSKLLAAAGLHFAAMCVHYSGGRGNDVFLRRGMRAAFADAGPHDLACLLTVLRRVLNAARASEGDGPDEPGRAVARAGGAVPCIVWISAAVDTSMTAMRLGGGEDEAVRRLKKLVDEMMKETNGVLCLRGVVEAITSGAGGGLMANKGEVVEGKKALPGYSVEKLVL